MDETWTRMDETPWTRAKKSMIRACYMDMDELFPEIWGLLLGWLSGRPTGDRRLRRSLRASPAALVSERLRTVEPAVVATLERTVLARFAGPPGGSLASSTKDAGTTAMTVV